MAKGKITACEAKARLRKRGLNMDKSDFFGMTGNEQWLVLEAARAAGYRKSKNAPGSTARMFASYLRRKKCG